MKVTKLIFQATHQDNGELNVWELGRKKKCFSSLNKFSVNCRRTLYFSAVSNYSELPAPRGNSQRILYRYQNYITRFYELISCERFSNIIPKRNKTWYENFYYQYLKLWAYLHIHRTTAKVRTLNRFPKIYWENAFLLNNNFANKYIIHILKKKIICFLPFGTE